jgi:hypothetical protein
MNKLFYPHRWCNSRVEKSSKQLSGLKLLPGAGFFWGGEFATRRAVADETPCLRTSGYLGGSASAGSVTHWFVPVGGTRSIVSMSIGETICSVLQGHRFSNAG